MYSFAGLSEDYSEHAPYPGGQEPLLALQKTAFCKD